MKRPNITKGEWHNTNKPLIVQAECPETGWGYTVANCSDGSQDYSEQLANSLAIAAIPDLLKALEFAHKANANNFMEMKFVVQAALAKSGYTF